MPVVNIIFCSPDTFVYDNDYLILEVDEEMLQEIRKGPRMMVTGSQSRINEETSSSREEYCYVFGDEFDASILEHPGFLLTSSDQIGFIDDKLAKKRHKEIKGNQPPDAARRNRVKKNRARRPAKPPAGVGFLHKPPLPTKDFQKTCGPFPTDDNQITDYMTKVTKEFPEIIWIGSNHNRDNVHLHYMVDPKRDRVCSIVLDCGYVYSTSFPTDKKAPEISSEGEDTDYEGELRSVGV